MSVTYKTRVSDAAADISERNQGGILTFAIRVNAVESNQELAIFPFAGTLQQTIREACRFAECFSIEVDALVMAWFEVED